MTSTKLLEQTVCIHLDISLWSGTRCLTDDDLDDATGLPPKDLASRGAIKLCDPDILHPLSNIKRAAERDCESVCLSFMGRYATFENELTSLAKKLAARKAQFNAIVSKLGTTLPGAMQSWANAHEDWTESIEREIANVPRFLARYDFKYPFFRVGAAGDSDELNSGLVQATQGLSGQLFYEIQKEATLAFKRSYQNKGAVGQKALKPLHRILQKLDALQYLDARCGAMMERIRLVLGSLPSSGPIKEPHLSALVGLFATLGCKQAMISQGPAQSDALGDVHTPDVESDSDDVDEQAPAPHSLPLPLDLPSRTPSVGPVPSVSTPAAALWI